MEEPNDYVYDSEDLSEGFDYLKEMNYDNEYDDTGLLAKDQTSSIFFNLFKNSNNLGVDEAKKLIKLWQIQVLADNLPKFEWLDNDIAKKLIQKGYIGNLAKWLFSFKNLDKKIAKILAKNRIWAISSNLTSFVNLDDEIAQMLIKNEYYNVIAKDIDRFEKLSNETLLALLVNCTKYRRSLIFHKSIFPKWWAEDKKLLAKLKVEWRDIESKKLKEFYDTILFQEEKKDFELNNKFDKWFNLYDAREAIKYGEWRLIIEYLDQFVWNDHRKLINLLLEWNYIEDIKNILPKLWWKCLNRWEIVHQLCLTNNYNVLINNSDNFECEKISNIEIAEEIIENWTVLQN